MELISESFLKKYLLNFAFLLSLIIIFVLFWKYLIPYILPFLIAYVLSLISRPIIRKFDRAGISRVVTALLCTLFLYLGIGSGTYFIVRRLIMQLSEFAAAFMESPEEYFSPISQIINSISERYPKIVSLIDFEPLKESFLEKLAGYAGIILEKSAELAISMPNILLFLFAMICSTYYFIKNYNKNGAAIDRLLPKTIRAIVFYCKNLFVKYLRQYLISMSIMMIIVFFMLMLGFRILGFRYFVLISLIVALIDMLPVLGVGTVLIPWSIYYFITGNLTRGIGLIVMYILIVSVRQIIEPRLIGKKVGLSPLMTLISVYIGFRAFGIWGIIFAPFVAVIISSIIKDMSENSSA